MSEPNMPGARPLRALADPHAEQMLLAALLVRPEKLDDLPADFSPAHYADPLHRDIHEVIVADGRADRYVASRLMQTVYNADPDTRAYISQLVGGLAGTGSSLIRDCAGTITGLWARRRLVEIGETMADRARTEPLATAPAPAIVAAAASELDEIAKGAANVRKGCSLREAVDEAIRLGERARAGDAGGIATGFYAIDRMIGPMEGGAVYYLAGRPGMGKSALALQIALRMSAANLPVLYVSLEMQARQLGMRALAVASAVNAETIHRGEWTSAQADRLVQARNRMAEMPLRFEDQGEQNCAMIGVRARAMLRSMGLAAIVVDHIHLIDAGPDAGRNPTWAVGRVSAGIKAIAKDLDVPILALAQLKRIEGREDKRPTMEDLRQSGSIEQDAEVIMFLYRPEYYLPLSAPDRKNGETMDQHEARVAEWQGLREAQAGKAELIIPKNRNGVPGMIPLRFDADRTAFADVAAEPDYGSESAYDRETTR